MIDGIARNRLKNPLKEGEVEGSFGEESQLAIAAGELKQGPQVPPKKEEEKL